MNTIYKDGKEIIQCIQYDGENIKEVGDFLKEHKINWGGPRGGPYTINCTHGKSILYKTDWILKRQNDIVVMSDKDFHDTYDDMIILRPLCTDFTNMGGQVGQAMGSGTTGRVVDPLEHNLQVANLKPLVIPPAHAFKQVGEVIKSEPVLSREDEFILQVACALISSDRINITPNSEFKSKIKILTMDLMSIADEIKAENNNE